MNKLQRILYAFMSEYDLNHEELVEALENTSRLIDYAEIIGVELCQEEAELISKSGLEMINKFNDGDGEWDLYRKEALERLDIAGIN